MQLSRLEFFSRCVFLLLTIAASEAALLTHLGAEGKAASASRLLQSLKAAALLLGREDAFRKPCEHWSHEAWPANILSAADRAQKDCLKPDNSVTSYLTCKLLQLVWWKLEMLSRARRFFFFKTFLERMGWEICNVDHPNCLLHLVQKRSWLTAATCPHWCWGRNRAGCWRPEEMTVGSTCGQLTSPTVSW